MRDTDNILKLLREEKEKLGYTCEYISKNTNVPLGTVIRVFGKENHNYRYDTLKPIAKFVLGWDDLDNPEKENPLPAHDTISMLKYIIEEKNAEIAELKAEHKSDLSYLRSECKTEVNSIREDYENKINYLKTSVVEPLKKDKKVWQSICIPSLIIIVIILIADIIFSDKGWILREIADITSTSKEAFIFGSIFIFRFLFNLY